MVRVYQCAVELSSRCNNVCPDAVFSTCSNLMVDALCLANGLHVNTIRRLVIVLNHITLLPRFLDINVWSPIDVSIAGM